MRKVLLYIVLAAFVYWFINRYRDRNKYLGFLHDLKFGVADEMSFDELRTSYTYLHDYAQTYGANASQMLKGDDPVLWNKAKQISLKYGIFNI